MRPAHNGFQLFRVLIETRGNVPRRERERWHCQLYSVVLAVIGSRRVGVRLVNLGREWLHGLKVQGGYQDDEYHDAAHAGRQVQHMVDNPSHGRFADRHHYHGEKQKLYNSHVRRWLGIRPSAVRIETPTLFYGAWKCGFERHKDNWKSWEMPHLGMIGQIFFDNIGDLADGRILRYAKIICVLILKNVGDSSDVPRTEAVLRDAQGMQLISVVEIAATVSPQWRAIGSHLGTNVKGARRASRTCGNYSE
jgi:hypothetical protein